MKYSGMCLLLLWTLGLDNANALGVGGLEPESRLNEPLEARLSLSAATPPEIDTMTVRLAGAEDFQRLAVEYPAYLDSLRFEVLTPEQGDSYVRVYSTRPVREPALNLVLEIRWSGGRLLREFALLLDPPGLPPPVPVAPPPVSDWATAAPADPAEPVEPAAAPPPAAAQQYGPVAANQTLWSIASQHRPSGRIAPDQMMIGIFRANPDAFISNNINLLRRGAILHIPSEQEMLAIDAAAARQEVQAHKESWQRMAPSMPPRRAAPASPPAPSPAAPVPAPAAASPPPPAAPPPDRPDGELQVVTPGTEGAGAAGAGGSAAENAQLKQQLLLAQESIEALTQENTEYRARLQELEALSADRQRLLTLKDQNLAMLQQQLAEELAKPKAVEAAEAPPPPPAAEPPPPSPAVEAPPPPPAAEAPPPPPPPEPPPDVAQPPPSPPPDVAAAPAADQAAPQPADADAAAAPVEAEAAPVETEAAQGLVGSMVARAWFLAGRFRDMATENKYVRYGLLGLVVLLLLAIVSPRIGDWLATARYRRRQREEEEDEDSLTLAMAESSADVEADEMIADEDLNALDDIDDVGTVEQKPAPAADLAVADRDEATGPDLEISSIGDAGMEAPDIGAPAPAPAPPAAGEDDATSRALVAVDTYLAFEQYDQAEEAMVAVIQSAPKNPAHHLKLLEVFYASGNRQSYEEEAKVLHELVGGQGEVWNSAVAMWSEMSKRPLFSEAAEAEEEVAAVAPSAATGGVVDLLGGAEPEEAGGEGALDLDLGSALDETAGHEEITADAGAAGEETAGDAGGLDALGEDEDLLSGTFATDTEEKGAAGGAASLQEESGLSLADTGGDGMGEGEDLSLDELTKVSAPPPSAREPQLDTPAQEEDEDLSLDELTKVSAPPSSARAPQLDTPAQEEDEDLSLDELTKVSAPPPSAREPQLDTSAQEEDEGLSLDDLTQVAAAPEAQAPPPAPPEDEDAIEFEPGLMDEMTRANQGQQIGDEDVTELADVGAGIEYEAPGADDAVQAGEAAGGEEIVLSIDDVPDEPLDSEADEPAIPAADEDEQEALSLEMEGAGQPAVDDEAGEAITEMDMANRVDDTLVPGKPESPDARLDATFAIDSLEPVDEMDEGLEVDTGAGDAGTEADRLYKTDQDLLLDHTAQVQEASHDSAVVVPSQSDGPASGENGGNGDMSGKLDLARAVIELGDHDRAREVLNSILNDPRCDSEQRQQAQKLLFDL